MNDQLDRNLYQHLVIGFSMGLLTLFLCFQSEPTWIPAQRALELRGEGALFVDTRTAMAFGKNGFPGAINIPYAEIDERLHEIPRDRPVVVYGAFGNDSLRTYDYLKRRGYDVYDLGPWSRMPYGAMHAHVHHAHHDHHGER